MKVRDVYRRRGELVFRVCNRILLKLMCKLYRAFDVDSRYCVNRDNVFVAIDAMKFDYSFQHMGCTGNFDYYPKQEIESRKIFGSMITGGEVVFDIGAHGGLYTVWLKTLFPELTVYSFEPLADELKRNLALNNLSLDNVCEVGLGAIEENARITVNERSSNHLTAGSVKGSRMIDIVTLDKYISVHALKAPDLIKIDIEGMEYYALKGAAGLLKNYSPIVMAEINGLFSRYYDEIGEFMYFMSCLDYEIYCMKLGKLYRVEIDSIRDLADLPASADNNYWFIPAVKRQFLSSKLVFTDS